MTVDGSYQYFIRLDSQTNTATVHLWECGYVAEAGQRGLIGDVWKGPIEGWEDVENKVGCWKIRLCAECEPEPDPCDPDSYEDCVIERHLKGDPGT